MKLIDEWKSAYKMFSVNAMALAAAIQGTWVSLDETVRSELPKDIVHYATIALLVAGIGGRLVKQTPPEDK